MANILESSRSEALRNSSQIYYGACRYWNHDKAANLRRDQCTADIEDAHNTQVLHDKVHLTEEEGHVQTRHNSPNAYATANHELQIAAARQTRRKEEHGAQGEVLDTA